MKYYLSCLILMVITVTFVTIFPNLTQSTEEFLIESQIPQNNSATLGVQNYIVPPVGGDLQPPQVSARSVLIKDLATSTILYQKDEHLRLPVASTTKIMTALIADGFFQPNDPLIVKEAAKVTGARVGLSYGEILSFRSLLYGMLLSSGNDAAYAIAENYPGGVKNFVEAMNEKALSLNLTDTHFENPTGFDSPNHFSSSFDMAKITEKALKSPQLLRIFATKDTQILSVDKKYHHQLSNLNKLLSQVKGVLGVKTGYTEAAKENLVTLVERDRHQILVVVLGSDDRFGESTQLIEWTYTNFTWSDFGTVRQ